MTVFTINVNVNIDAPGLETAIYKLADAMEAASTQPKAAAEESQPVITDFAEYEKQLDANKERPNPAKTEKPKFEPDQAMPDTKPKFEPDQAMPEPEPETAPEETINGTEEKYSAEDVRAAIADISKKKGREVAKGILDTLGVRSVSNLKPEQYAEAMRLAREV